MTDTRAYTVPSTQTSIRAYDMGGTHSHHRNIYRTNHNAPTSHQQYVAKQRPILWHKMKNEHCGVYAATTQTSDCSSNGFECVGLSCMEHFVFSYIHHYVQLFVHSYTWYCTKGSSHIVKVEKQKSVSLDSSIVLIGCVCMRVADSPVYYYYYNIVQIGKEINNSKKK